MLSQVLSLGEAAYSSVSRLCDAFLRRSGAVCALLVGQDGMLLHQSGSVEGLDVDGLSAVSAGAFASTGEMARMIGESGFDFVMQQGRRSHLQLTRVGDSAILVAVFDHRTTPGMVRLQGQRVARRLARLLDDTGSASAEQHQSPWAGTPDDETGPDEDGADLDGRRWSRAEQFRADLRMRTIAFAVALLAAATAVVGALLRH